MKNEQLKFWCIVSVRTGVAACAVGWLMLILNWQGSEIVFTFGGVLSILSYACRTWLKEFKSSMDWTKLILVFSIFTRGIVGVNHWSFPEWLWMALGIIILVSIVYIFIKDSNSLIPSANQNVISKLLFSAAGSFIAIGVMFEIMHWPWAGPLLTLGTISLVLWLILEPFIPSLNHSSYNTDNSFTTLDESLTEDVLGPALDYKRPKNKPVFFLAGLLMLLGLVMSVLNLPGGEITILGGLVIGAAYLFLTLRN